MKTLILLLVMMVMTAPSYTQSDRRTTSKRNTVEYQNEVQEEKNERRRHRTSETNNNIENRYENYDTQRRKTENYVRENYHKHEDVKIIKPQKHYEYEVYVRKTHRGEIRYRRPANYVVVWTPAVRERIIRIYPSIRIEFNYGYRIPDIPAYLAYKHAGRLVNVFGYVVDIDYIHRYDEYILYIGDRYPYHDLTVIISGHVARRIHPRPERFFRDRDILVTGVIYLYRDIPEIEVKDPWQINVYY